MERLGSPTERSRLLRSRRASYDVRPAAREQVESVGAKFVELKNEDLWRRLDAAFQQSASYLIYEDAEASGPAEWQGLVKLAASEVAASGLRRR